MTGVSSLRRLSRGLHFPPVRARDNPRRRGVSAETDQQHSDTKAASILLNHFKMQMIMKHFFFLPWFKWSEKIHSDKSATPSDEIPEPLYPYEHDPETSDGSEFLDDNFRMSEVALSDTGTNSGIISDEYSESPTRIDKVK